MKKIFYVIVAIYFSTNLYSQNTVEKKEYYDVWETQIKRIWHELGDGNKQGVEKSYYANGEIKYIHNWVNGTWISLKYYFQDGQIRLESNKNINGEYDGEQLFYLFENGKRYLKVKAIVSNDVVNEYYFYEHTNLLGWSIKKTINDYTYKKYDREGNEIVNITLSDGTFSGIISKTDYDKYKLYIENNSIKTFESNGRLTKEVRPDLIFSDYEQEGLLWKMYRSKTHKHEYQIQGELLIDLYNVQIAYDIKVKELKFKREFIWYPDPTTSSVKTSINTLVNSIFSQYTEDSIKTAVNSEGSKVKEIKYDNGKLIWTKDYWDNGKIKTQKFGERKYTLSGFNTQRILSYNEDGILIKESELDNYIIYNTEGEVVESKEMSDTITEIRNRLNNDYYKIKSMIEATDDYMSETFCLSNENGDFLNVCYDKTNKNIFLAISVLYQEYLNKRKKIISIGSNSGYFKIRDNEKYNSIELMSDKIEYLKKWEKYYLNLEPFLLEFDKEIEPFIDILNDQEKTKTINKKVKKVNDPNEIKMIINSII